MEDFVSNCELKKKNSGHLPWFKRNSYLKEIIILNHYQTIFFSNRLGNDEPTKWNMIFFLSVLNLVGEEHCLQVKYYSECVGFTVYMYIYLCAVCVCESSFTVSAWLCYLG